MVACFSNRILVVGPAGDILPRHGKLWPPATGWRMMIRVLIYCCIAALAVCNGIASPQALTIFALQGIWYPSVLPSSLTLMFVLSGTICTLLHAIVTGIPTAILERALPGYRNSAMSAALWLAVMLIPTTLTLLPMLGNRA
jgi:ABC-type phosphate transport system permease subunit